MSFLPEFDRGYLEEKDIKHREVNDNGRKGLIIPDVQLPAGKYDREKADILIILPQGYRDIPPDMFFLNPGVSLMPENKPPKATQATITFDGKVWQRWSRHFPGNHWRPGIDGMHTFIKKIETALKEAQPE